MSTEALTIHKPLPLLGLLTSRQRKIYALYSLDPQAVASQPVITPQLRAIARDTAKIIPYGPSESPTLGIPILDTTEEFFDPKDPLYYLRASSDPAAKSILERYYHVHVRYRATFPLEAYCLMADVPTTRCFEIIVATCIRIGAQASVLLRAVSEPAIVKKTIDMAMTDEGFQDRAMLHKSSGFLPTPRGPSVNVPVTVNAQANAQAVVAPPPERTISRLADRFNDARLPGGDSPSPPVVEVVDAEAEEPEEESEE